MLMRFFVLKNVFNYSYNKYNLNYLTFKDGNMYAIRNSYKFIYF